MPNLFTIGDGYNVDRRVKNDRKNQRMFSTKPNQTKPNQTSGTYWDGLVNIRVSPRIGVYNDL
jgi:hypothetical protein